MRTTQTVKTIKRTSGPVSSGIGSGNRTLTTTRTQVISGPNATGTQQGLRRSSRGSRVWKKTVLGEKFEYSEKLREKKNYILYVSGMGHEKKQIEEIEEIPKPEPPKVIEVKEIIDNYGYHETKNVKKQNPKRLSITHHERLSTPFERTTLKKFSSYTSTPQIRQYTSTSVPKTRFDTESVKKTRNINTNLTQYNSMTAKQQKTRTIVPPKLYETYKPTKTEYTKTTRTITTSKTPVNVPSQPRNKPVTQSQITKTKTEITRVNDRRTNQNQTQIKTQTKTQTQNVSKYQKPKIDVNKYKKPIPPADLGRNQTKTETTQDGEYVVKVTTTRTQLARPEERSRGGSAPRALLKPRNMNEMERPRPKPAFEPPRKSYGFGGPHGPYGPHFMPHGPMGPHHGFGGPMPRRPEYGRPRPEEKESEESPESEVSVEKERARSVERPPRFMAPHGPYGAHGFMGPHGPYGMPHGPHGFMGTHGPMPHGPYGMPQGPHHEYVPHGPHKEYKPHGPHGFMGPHHEYVPHGPQGQMPHGPHHEYVPHGPNGPMPHGPHGMPHGPHHEYVPHGSMPHGPYGMPHGPHHEYVPHGPNSPMPHGPHGLMGPPHEYMPHGPHKEYMPHGPHGFIGPHHEYVPHGPMPHGPYGPHGFMGPHFSPPHHHGSHMESDYCPRGEIGEGRRSTSVPKPISTFQTRTFQVKPGFSKKPEERTIQARKFGGLMFQGPKEERRSGSYREERFLTEGDARKERKDNITGMSQYRFQQTTNKSDNGDNYEYFESKHVVKKGRVNQPITIHHRRGVKGDYETSKTFQISQIKKDNRSSSYNKTSYQSQSQSQRQSQNQSQINTQSNIKTQTYTKNYKLGAGASTTTTAPKITTTKYTQKTTIQNYRKEQGKAPGANQYKQYTQKVASSTGGSGAYDRNKYEMKKTTTTTTEIKKGWFGKSKEQEKEKKVNQNQTFDEGEFEIVFCPVHGRQLVKKKKFRQIK